MSKSPPPPLTDGLASEPGRDEVRDEVRGSEGGVSGAGLEAGAWVRPYPCGGCGQNLRGVEGDPVICPTCGEAWPRIDRDRYCPGCGQNFRDRPEAVLECGVCGRRSKSAELLDSPPAPSRSGHWRIALGAAVLLLAVANMVVRPNTVQNSERYIIGTAAAVGVGLWLIQGPLRRKPGADEAAAGEGDAGAEQDVGTGRGDESGQVEGGDQGERR